MNKKKIVALIIVIIVLFFILEVWLLTVGMRKILSQTETACDSFYKATLEKTKQGEAEPLPAVNDDNSIRAKNKMKMNKLTRTIFNPLYIEAVEWAKEKNSALPKKSDSWNYFELSDNLYKRLGILWASGIIIANEAISEVSFFELTKPYTDTDGAKSSEPISPAAFSGIVSKAKSVNPANLDFITWCEHTKNFRNLSGNSGSMPPTGDQKRPCLEAAPVLREFAMQLKEKFDSAEPNSYTKVYRALEILELECLSTPQNCKLKATP